MCSIYLLAHYLPRLLKYVVFSWKFFCQHKSLGFVDQCVFQKKKWFFLHKIQSRYIYIYIFNHFYYTRWWSCVLAHACAHQENTIIFNLVHNKYMAHQFWCPIWPRSKKCEFFHMQATSSSHGLVSIRPTMGSFSWALCPSWKCEIKNYCNHMGSTSPYGS